MFHIKRFCEFNNLLQKQTKKTGFNISEATGISLVLFREDVCSTLYTIHNVYSIQIIKIENSFSSSDIFIFKLIKP